MRYYCDICLRDIKKKSKYCFLKSKSHEEFEKYEHIILSLKNVDIKDVGETLYLYVNAHNKKLKYYLIKGQLKLVFNNIRDFKYLFTGMINITTNISWSKYLREAIDNIKEEYDFSHIAEMDIITLAHKRDMTYDFYLKHIMPAFEWKVNAMINKNKNLINKFLRNWRHPFNINYNCYRNNNI